MEQEVISIAAESSDFKMQVVSEVTKLKMGIEQGDNSGNGEDQEDFYLSLIHISEPTRR